MRRPLFAAILALAPSPLLAASFDLSLDDTNGERVVVVARADGGVFTVAAGGEDLKILKGEDADRARARLAKMDAEAFDDLADDDEAGDKKKKKKIVIHKMDVDEAEDGDDEKSIVRVIRKTDGERYEESLIENDLEPLLHGDDDSAAAVERRVIRMKGADEARAIKFIDETKGLDDGEKAEMKAAVGL